MKQILTLIAYLTNSNAHKTRWSEKNSILDLKFRSWNYDQSTASVFEVCAFFFFVRFLLDFSFRLFSTWKWKAIWSCFLHAGVFLNTWILSFSGLMRLKGSDSENKLFVGRNLALMSLKFDLDLEIIWFNVSTSYEFQRKIRAPIFAFNIYSQWCVFDLYYEQNLTENRKSAREEKTLIKKKQTALLLFIVRSI